VKQLGGYSAFQYNAKLFISYDRHKKIFRAVAIDYFLILKTEIECTSHFTTFHYINIDISRLTISHHLLVCVFCDQLKNTASFFYRSCDRIRRRMKAVRVIMLEMLGSVIK